MKKCSNLHEPHCVIVPFYNRLNQVTNCVELLLEQALENSIFLLIDDGSSPSAASDTKIKSLLQKINVHLITHPDNCGVSAARNSALHWCKEHDVEIVIMIDSDCLVESNVISEHLRLHKEHTDAACIGASIEGYGKGFWAKLDGVASWVHALPRASHDNNNNNKNEFHKVEHPYHLATTNFSVKLAQLPQRDFIFNERLATGEDCFLIRELRREKKAVYFSATPNVKHHDREDLLGVIKHHYRWGHHQYFIQLGGDISPRCFNVFYRLLFFALFLPLLPAFALLGAVLNIKPWWAIKPTNILYFPFIYGLWLAKGIAVLEACVRPETCLRKARVSIVYEE